MKGIPEHYIGSKSCEIPRWEVLKSKLQNHSPQEFQDELSKHPDGILLDVRTVAEAAGSKLSNATVMDYLGANFLDQMDALDKSKTYFVYCQSGRRSVRTCTMMRNAGFENLHHLDGGLNAWQQER